jgi:hypothetical protein
MNSECDKSNWTVGLLLIAYFISKGLALLQLAFIASHFYEGKNHARIDPDLLLCH